MFINIRRKHSAKKYETNIQGYSGNRKKQSELVEKIIDQKMKITGIPRVSCIDVK